MITIRVSGALGPTAANVIGKALKDFGLSVEHWEKIIPGDERDARAAAKRARADILLLEMQKPKKRKK